MRVVFGTLLALFAFSTGRLVLVNDQLIHERDLLLQELETESAHTFFDNDARKIVGNVSVEAVPGKGYRAHGQLFREGRISDWRFDFTDITEIAIIPQNVEVDD